MSLGLEADVEFTHDQMVIHPVLSTTYGLCHSDNTATRCVVEHGIVFLSDVLMLPGRPVNIIPCLYTALKCKDCVVIWNYCL